MNSRYGSHCARVVEVQLNADGSSRLLRVVCGIDPGHVVNPDTIDAQVERAVTAVWPPRCSAQSASGTAASGRPVNTRR